MKRLILSIGLFLLLAFLAACGDLAGDVEIVGQLTTSAPLSTNLTFSSSEPNLVLGAQLFAENCTRCHGTSGAGDGEFVLSGEITEIPNFTDPAQHQGRDATEYYITMTQGRLEKLMPPFGASLSDEERWSVANYLFTLAGTNAPAPETTEMSPEATAEVHQSTVGTISGNINQGTAGGAIPVGSGIRLIVIDMLGTETSFEAVVNGDGSYLFPNIPIAESTGYRVMFEYAGGTFSSEFVVGVPSVPNMTLDTTIYETTGDDAVLQINVVLSQIDFIDENHLQVWQMINVTNLSDRLYTYQNANGRSVSVRIPVPAGFSLSPANDLDRFVYNGATGSIYDTWPVVPFVEHSFYLVYTVPFAASLTVNQLFDYEFFGSYEVYADSSVLNLSGNAWRDLGEQTVNGTNYKGIGITEGDATGIDLQFTINRNFLINRNMLGYTLMLLGIIFIIGATFLYWRNRGFGHETSQSTNEPIEALLKAIADLDERFEAKQIKRRAYERERQALKAKLLALMKDSQ